jgi:hypothetical protein
LIFRLNNTPSGDCAGLELSQPCSESSKISPEIFGQTLQFFVKGISERKGIEKNLWAKKFIKNIIYSPSDIQINLYYSTDFGILNNSVLPYGVGMGGDKNPQKEQRTSALNHESPQFELCKMAPLLKLTQNTFK